MPEPRRRRKAGKHPARSSVDGGESARLAIRHARLEDSAAVKELMRDLGYRSTTLQIRRRISLVLASVDSAIFIAETDLQVVGVVSIHCLPLLHADGRLGRITSLSVASGFRQRGAGTSLVAAATKFARTRGCERLEVTSGDGRPEAHAFYESIGFHRTSQRFIKNCP